MKFKEDILQKIQDDFKDSANKVVEILSAAISKTDYLKTDRIIRCIIFLSDGDVVKLQKYIDNAINDPRDVMLWAEYEKLDDILNHKRIRDFNETFNKCTENVKE